MEFQSNVSIPSQSLDGVTVFVRTPTRRLRSAFDLRTADSIRKLRDLKGERDLLEPEAKPHREAAKAKDCTCAHEEFDHDHDSFTCTVEGCGCRHPEFPAELREKMIAISERENQVIFGEIYPAAFRFWVVRIEGLQMDGKTATVESVIAAELDLVDEVAMKIDALIRLSTEERKNSERPTTSTGPVDGPSSTTTAPTAGSSCSIVPTLVTSKQTEEIAAVSPI